MMTLKRDDRTPTNESVESHVGSTAGEDRDTAPVSTHLGRDTVEIDASALRHLVDTMKAKLRP
jgi:hypothetical protein